MTLPFDRSAQDLRRGAVSLGEADAIRKSARSGSASPEHQSWEPLFSALPFQVIATQTCRPRNERPEKVASLSNSPKGRASTMRTMLKILAVSSLAALPAAASAETRSIVVFFTEWSARIDEPAGVSIKEAADLAKQRGAGRVTVTGFADDTGPAKAAALVSAARAQVVVDRLVANGVPQRRIRMRSKGATAFVESSLESHRVTIEVVTR